MVVQMHNHMSVGDSSENHHTNINNWFDLLLTLIISSPYVGMKVYKLAFFILREDLRNIVCYNIL